MSSRPLILGFDTFKLEKQILSEEIVANGKYKGNPKLILKGILQRSDTLNQNGRVYPMNVLAREVRNYQKLINERRSMGALDHTDSSIIELNTVSHIVTEARMDNGVVYGTIEILPTPSGDVLRSLVEANVTVGISSRENFNTMKFPVKSLLFPFLNRLSEVGVAATEQLIVKINANIILFISLTYLTIDYFFHYFFCFRIPQREFYCSI